MNNLHVNAAISFPPLERSLSMADPDFEVRLWGERERERERERGGGGPYFASFSSFCGFYFFTYNREGPVKHHQSRPNI